MAVTVDFWSHGKRIYFSAAAARQVHEGWASAAKEDPSAEVAWIEERLSAGGPFELTFDGEAPDLDQDALRSLARLNGHLIRRAAADLARRSDERDVAIRGLAKLLEVQAMIESQVSAPRPLDINDLEQLTELDRAECEAERMLLRDHVPSAPLTGPRLPAVEAAIELLEKVVRGGNDPLAALYYSKAGSLMDADDLEGALAAATRSAEVAQSAGRRNAAVELMEGVRELLS